MLRPILRTAFLAPVVLLSLAACDTSTEPVGSGKARVVLSGSSASAASVLETANLMAASGPVSLESVASIDVRVTRVELHRSGDDEAADSADAGSGGWVSLELSEASPINLLALPGAAEGGIQLAAGDLPAGEYQKVRLFFDQATITFSSAVSLGNGAGAKSYEAGTTYDLIIPSGTQTGIKINGLNLSVGGDGAETANLVFESGTSVRNINVTGRGIQMSPVLRVRGSAAGEVTG